MSEIGQKIIAAVRKHAAEDPSYEYEAWAEDPYDGERVKVCRYVVDGCPSCIVGKGLWDTGLIDAGIEHLDANSAPFNRFSRGDFPVIEQLDGRELEWLSNVQRAQDSGTPWGVAVNTSDELVEAF